MCQKILSQGHILTFFASSSFVCTSILLKDGQNADIIMPNNLYEQLFIIRPHFMLCFGSYVSKITVARPIFWRFLPLAPLFAHQYSWNVDKMQILLCLTTYINNFLTSGPILCSVLGHMCQKLLSRGHFLTFLASSSFVCPSILMKRGQNADIIMPNNLY